MAHATAETVELPVRRLDPIPGRLRMIALAALVLGAIGLVAAFLVDGTRAWQAYLFNWLYFTGIAHGAVMLAAVVSIAKGLWSRPIRRFALAFVAFTPISYLLLLVLFAFGREHVFPWLHMDLGDGPKSVWLNLSFVVTRNVILLGALVVVELLFAYWSLRPDVGLVRGDAPARVQRLYERLTRGWRGQEAEELHAYRKLSVLGPVLALLYATALSFVAWDLIMSLEPYWWSTLFGPYYFMASLLSGIAATVVATVLLRSFFGWEHVILPHNLHDIGKLNFAFVIFWGYLFWSQFIVIWYGMIPHEQSYVVHRLSGGFAPISILVFLFVFLFPFFGLLGVRPKRTPALLGSAAAIVLVGLFLERYLLTYPSWYYREGEIVFGWQEIAFALFFGGLLLASITAFMSRFPLLQHWQPLSELELAGVHAPSPSQELDDEEFRE